MAESTGPQRHGAVWVFGETDPDTLRQAETCARTAVHSLLLADNHLGWAQPVGGVTAYREHVSVSGVGYDIACGNKAVRLDTRPAEARARRHEWLDEIEARIPFGVGRKTDQPLDHPVLDDPLYDILEREAGVRPSRGYASLREMAAAQLGTVGGGNHYVDIFVSERHAVWIGVHFGSRGFGHRIASRFLELAGARPGVHVEPALLPLDSELGQLYWAGMELAGRYAYAGRDLVCAQVAAMVGATIVEEVHNHHNFAWREQHGDEDLIVVRKGATPAFPGQRGFVGGSMGDISVILAGRESSWSAAALRSTVHGAGRTMSRTRAAGKLRRRGGRVEVLRPGEVRPEAMQAWLTERDVHLRGGGLDESPHCYRRLPDVLAAQGDTIEVQEILHPIGVVMAPADTHDPYRD